MAGEAATESAAPASTDAVPSKELSKPLGVNDDAIWSKHFGKDSKDSKDSKGSKKPPAEREAKPSSKSATSPKESARTSESDSKGTSKDTSKPSESSKKPSAESKERESSSSKDAKPDKPADKAEPKDAKPEETDPEAPSKKARDLYAAAKKAEDPKEARGLYKRALKEAFGEIPEEFDDSKYAAVRRERKAAKAVLDEQASKNEGRIREPADKLKPAIYVMRQLEGAGLGNLTVPLVERAVHTLRAVQAVADGDYTQLAEVLHTATGLDHDEAMKRFIQGVKVSPEGRRSRQEAQEASRRAQAAEASVAELTKKLQERDTQQTEAQKKQEHDRAVAENRALYLEQIETDLDGHPVLQLPRGKERVMAYIIKTANPKLKAATMTFEQAANRIVAHEKKRLAATKFLEEGGDGAAPTGEIPQRLRNVSRSETRDDGVRSESAEAAFDRIYGKHTAGAKR